MFYLPHQIVAGISQRLLFMILNIPEPQKFVASKLGHFLVCADFYVCWPSPLVLGKVSFFIPVLQRMEPQQS